MSINPAPFDSLAGVYQRSRPDYPDEFMRRIAELVPAHGKPPNVLDAGAGTGIALGQLMQCLNARGRFTAVDISARMIEVGQRICPAAEWRLGRVEDLLNGLCDLDLILCAQALQWFDRPAFYAAAAEALAPGGCLAVLQNNRDWESSAFLATYEQLLEDLSPGYFRLYRAFDVARELSQLPWTDAALFIERRSWTRWMAPSDFAEMSRSSTRVQAALKANGPAFETRLSAMCDAFVTNHGLAVPYVSELFIAMKSTGGRP